MFQLVRYKPTGEIVACGSCIPNIFHKDKNGNYDTIIYHTWAINPEHRRKGLSLLMYGATSLQAWKSKYRYAMGHTGSDNISSIKAVENLGAKATRWHLILEYQL